MTELASQVDSPESYLAFVRAALPRYGFGLHTVTELLNISENGTYRLTDNTRSAILRVHRIDYHSRSAIESELAWLTAIAVDTDIKTPTPIPAGDGELVIDLKVDGLHRHAVLFESIPGGEPQVGDLADSFVELGSITATMHQHASRWNPPASFSRFSWDIQHTLGDSPRWGRVDAAPSIGAHELSILTRAVDAVKRRLGRFGTSRDRFGLIHADLRIANLMVDDADICVIDFDDCGYGWNLYDFGSAVSFMEDDPFLPQWYAAWLQGYRTVRALPAEDEEEIDTFIMLRRLLLLAWIGSHGNTDLARQMSAEFTAGTCVLSERYLSAQSLH